MQQVSHISEALLFEGNETARAQEAGWHAHCAARLPIGPCDGISTAPFSGFTEKLLNIFVEDHHRLRVLRLAQHPTVVADAPLPLILHSLD